MSLHRASLFPDLDGYAAAAHLRYDSRRLPDELLTEQLQKPGDKGYRLLL
ncbi:hypothetical protein [Flaviaesturariibacter aridisoli]|nr:hypothetical protein [Flaviaesturariibacter aridisoli]